MLRRPASGPSRCKEPVPPGGHRENGAPVRRSAGAEAGRILADFVVEGARPCASCAAGGAEITARTAAGLLAASAPDLAARVAAYRAGYRR